MIYELENGGFSASAYGTWLTGMFDSKRAARYAFRLTPDQLSYLQKTINSKNKLISFEDMQKLKKSYS